MVKITGDGTDREGGQCTTSATTGTTKSTLSPFSPSKCTLGSIGTACDRLADPIYQCRAWKGRNWTFPSFFGRTAPSSRSTRYFSFVSARLVTRRPMDPHTHRTQALYALQLPGHLLGARTAGLAIFQTQKEGHMLATAVRVGW